LINKNFIKNLLRKEKDAIIGVIAFMSYNPTIGRVLEKDGVKKFTKIIIKMATKLCEIIDINDFDYFHNHYVNEIISTIRTSNNSILSYGQAQKPINVFFKVYTDWARKPNEEIRNKILPFLHVPLDSVVMKTIKKKDNNWYEGTIMPLINNRQQEFSLSKIDYEIYYEWQKYFRSNYSQKPLIFDVAWALNR
jgi:hypothetical protein